MSRAIPRIDSLTSSYAGGSGSRTAAAALVLLLTAAFAACGRVPATEPTPEEPASGLPPVPAEDGPLDLRVSYPRHSLAITTRDRNFIFGSAGSGDARVWINGREVEIQPNGAFLAFLPVPQDSVYRLRAALRGETQTLEVPVLLPRVLPGAGDGTAIVDWSVYPSGAWVAQPGERIEVGFTGTAGGEAWVELGDDRVPLVAVVPDREGVTNFEVNPDSPDAGARGDPARDGAWADYRGYFVARRVVAADTDVPWPTLTDELRPVRGLDPAGGASGELVLVAYGDTVRHPLALNLVVADPHRPFTGIGDDMEPPERNGDGRVSARPGPGGGPYHYLWANGVELELTGERNGAYRVRLTDDLNAWARAREVELYGPVAPPPTSRVSVVRLDPRPAYIDAHIGLDRRLPYRVDEGKRSLSVVVYGATSRANFLQHGRSDPYIERAEWSQPSDRAFRLDIRLTGMPWGHETFWSRTGDLVLRLRRPPAIDPVDPLRGLTVGVDAGHGGTDTLTMGPTGLTEADANLGIALALGDQLRQRGARVVMSRTSNTTISLVERTQLARREDVDIWISIHNNAFPDGVEPWPNAGTSVYYNHPRAAGLAWSVQRALVEELGLRDLGVGRADLHQPRFPWAPAILTENLFMMIPEHEAFLKTEEGRRRVARAHVQGLEAWLRQGARSEP